MKYKLLPRQISYWKFLFKKILHIPILLILLVSVQVSGEIVCKFGYKNQIKDLDAKTITLPGNIVAMSEKIIVNMRKDSSVQSDTTKSKIKPTIVFVIDHSGSMYSTATGTGVPPRDPNGNRFNVTRNLLDTLYKKFPDAEVGLVVFRGNLYFKKEDDPLVFATCPAQDSGAYIPLHVLNKKYNGTEGHKLLKKYLETRETVDPNNRPYIDLKYEPTGGWFDDKSGYTNITAGFDAAKHALKSSKRPKSNHFIIFLSDGEATYPTNNRRKRDEFEYGRNVSTTFTVFFTNLPFPPGSLRRMTNNIKNNGYSKTNPQSNLWAFENTDYNKLMDFLMKNVIQKIVNIKKEIPTALVINKKKITNYNKNVHAFISDKMFPLTGQKTDFKIRISYVETIDTVNSDGEVVKAENKRTEGVVFDVRIDKKAGLPNPFYVECWDRTMQFYHNRKKIAAANERTPIIELRFIERKKQILYGYENVNVILSSRKTKDKENLKLRDLAGNNFSRQFLTQATSQAKPGDGILQLKEKDTIVAFFQNAKLPLDSFTVTLPYSFRGLTGFSLRPLANSPINIKDIISNNGPNIPESIRRILKEDNKEEALSAGMLIQIAPFKAKIKDILSSDLELFGTLSIFDALGNTILKDREMGFHKKTKTLNFLWDCKNLQDRYVGSGCYLALFKISSKLNKNTDAVTNYDTIRLFIGVEY